MKKYKNVFKAVIMMILASVLISAGNFKKPEYKPQKGDILFQEMPGSKLTNAIRGIIGSKFTHCGILDYRNGEWMVIEALGEVRAISLKEWIRQGSLDQFAAYRIKENSQLKIENIMAEVAKMLGKPYDYGFETSDSCIYCSELIYKAVIKACGDSLGTMEELGTLNWKPYEQYIRSLCAGDLPLDRKLITPKAVSEAEQLQMIFSNFKYKI